MVYRQSGFPQSGNNVLCQPLLVFDQEYPHDIKPCDYCLKACLSLAETGQMAESTEIVKVGGAPPASKRALLGQYLTLPQPRGYSGGMRFKRRRCSKSKFLLNRSAHPMPRSDIRHPKKKEARGEPLCR